VNCDGKWFQSIIKGSDKLEHKGLSTCLVGFASISMFGWGKNGTTNLNDDNW